MPIVIDTNTVFPVTIRDVTPQWDGLMTAADKIKLDSLSPGGGTLRSAYLAGDPTQNTLPYTDALGPLVVEDAAAAGTGNYLGVTYGGSAQELFMVSVNGINMQWDSIGTASNFGVIKIENPTPAAAGAQQYSPDIRLRGNGFATGPAASRTVDFHMQVEPIQGAANPSGQFSIRSRINAGVANQVFTLGDTGDLNLTGKIVAFGSATASDSSFISTLQADSATALALEVATDNTFTTDGATVQLWSTGGNDVAWLRRVSSAWELGVTGGQLMAERDDLVTTTQTGALLHNTTAATNAVMIQVSPALTLESYFWNGVASTLHGAQFYHAPSASGPRAYLRLKNNGGAYADVGWFGYGYLASGFGIGDAGGTNWIDINGVAANTIRIVAGGASNSVFDANGLHPYADLGYPCGYSGARWSAFNGRDYYVGPAGGAGLGSGSGVISIGNAITAPTTDPTGGGVLYAQGGALKWRGSAGTVTTIAPA